MPPPPKRKNARAPPTSTSLSTLSTPDDILAHAVSLEESAEKHRAGASAKALRFYAAALEAYDAGLARFPSSFDLLYNRARALLAMGSHGGVAALVDAEDAGGKTALLRRALDAHTACLDTAQGGSSADVLYNAAVVRGLLAEESDETEQEGDNDNASAQRALAWREEAIQLLRRCFAIQEDMLSAREDEVRRGEELLAAQQAQDGDEDMAMAGSQEHAAADRKGTLDEGEGEEEGQWALIEEPITIDSLLDTSVLLADILAAAAGNAADLRSTSALQDMESTVAQALDDTAQRYIERAERADRVEACMARAKAKCALCDAAYALSLLDLPGYEAGVASAFANGDALVDAQDPRWLCAHAECLVEMADSAAEQGASVSKRWGVLEAALGLLAGASKAKNEAAELSGIHATRGDVELLRLALSTAADAPSGLQGDAVRRTLVQNAQKFYRGAKVCVQGDLTGAGQQALLVAQVKEAVAMAVERGSNETVKNLSGPGVSAAAVKGIIDEMMDDELLTPALAQSAGLIG